MEEHEIEEEEQLFNADEIEKQVIDVSSLDPRGKPYRPHLWRG